MRTYVDENEVTMLYKEGKSCRYIAKINKVSLRRITTILKNNGIRVKTKKEMLQKYKVNENYFDDIDSQDRAYILGLMYADGYNNEKNRCVRLSLKEDDKELLNRVKICLDSEQPLGFTEHQSSSYRNSKRQYYLNINNSHISKKLAELGCVQAKSHKLEFPKFLKESLFPHFIRGYFDGDGCITKATVKYITKSHEVYSVSFVGTENFLNKVSDIIQILLNIKKPVLTIRHKKRQNNTRSLSYGGNLQVEKILNWLYSGTTIHMKRKYDKYVELCSYNVKPSKLLCKICGIQHYGLGFCHRHYRKWKRGTLNINNMVL